MNGTLLAVGIILILMLTGLVNFINDLHDEVDVSYGYVSTSDMKNSDYYDINVVGDTILVFTALPESKKHTIWKSSSLRQDMLGYFPNFIKIKELVSQRVVDDGNFKKDLISKIENLEIKFIGGEISGQSAKATLSTY